MKKSLNKHRTCFITCTIFDDEHMSVEYNITKSEGGGVAVALLLAEGSG